MNIIHDDRDLEGLNPDHIKGMLEGAKNTLSEVLSEMSDGNRLIDGIERAIARINISRGLLNQIEEAKMTGAIPQKSVSTESRLETAVSAIETALRGLRYWPQVSKEFFDHKRVAEIAMVHEGKESGYILKIIHGCGGKFSLSITDVPGLGNSYEPSSPKWSEEPGPRPEGEAIL